MKHLRVLSFAAATGRIGHVLVWGEKLLDWGLSRKASLTPALAAQHAEKLIRILRPDVVVTEDVPKTSSKSSKTRAIIEAVARVAERARLLDVRTRPQLFPNKYAEADHLAEQFPELKPWKPKRRMLWDSEPRTTVLFEALALAVALA
jgi:hypothetical protein